MATRLDLIRFTRLRGKPCNKFGLKEVDERGRLVHLFNHEADQINGHPQASFKFVRTLGEMDDVDDFWRLIDGVKEITPSVVWLRW